MNSIIFNNSNNSKLDEANGNLMGTLLPTNSNDDDSLSLSEYTDNEKSAPTELLAEFLTSIMKKDYINALKYCKLILDYEPNNKTAKDFFPQLQAKVNEQNFSSNSDGSDENCNYTSSLDYVDNEILDNDFEGHNNSIVSSESSSISSDDEDESPDLSFSDEIDPNERDDLLISLSHSSSQCSNNSNSSKSDQLPESMSSTTSSNSHGHNTSNSISFTSLLLDDSNEIPAQISTHSPLSEPTATTTSHHDPSSPFSKKIIQIFKGNLN